MTTPICDFVRNYVDTHPLRLHIPGHKGRGTDREVYDITEISGADSLYEANGIIKESEANASELFGCPTFYSTEGSSLCIRTMLYLVTLYAREKGMTRPLIAAGRNAHKTFLSALAWLDLDVDWLYQEKRDSYLSCAITAENLNEYLSKADRRPVAVYVTSPDYLGHVTEIQALANICHRYGVLLLVDNAHGAYLKFLPVSRHPMDLGADLCCDSAHKTLPVLTGGAYLHIAAHLPPLFANHAKEAMVLFGSTSPSYLILASLDAANSVLSNENYRQGIAIMADHITVLRKRLQTHELRADIGDEALKLTIDPRTYGYTGQELADILRSQGIECEFADPDFIVFMFTPSINVNSIKQLERALILIPRRDPLKDAAPHMGHPERILSVREAALMPREILPVEQCVGRILASPSVGCPPAVPIVVCGERIDREAVQCFTYYGIRTCTVVKE